MKVSQIFMQILEMGWKASFVIIFILLIRGIVMRNFPKKYVYILWLVVGIRLVCPMTVPSSVSLFNLHLIPQNKAVILKTEDGKKNKASDSLSLTEQNSIQKKTELQSTEQKKESMQEQGSRRQKGGNKPDADISVIPVNDTAQAEAGDMPAEKGLEILSLVWLFGMLLLLFWNLFLTIRMKHRLRKAVLYQENIYECDEISSPFVMGMVHPRIYIPFRLFEEEREYVLKHEQYHIRRRDYLTKFISCLITSAYWFHPLVWISYFSMVRDMEMSCDEYVLATMGKDIRQDYSRLLLAFATNRRQFSANLITFGETDTRKRVKNIMKSKKGGKWIGALALLLLIIVGTVCLTSGKAEGVKERQDANIQGREETQREYQYPNKLEEYQETKEKIIAEDTVNGYQLQLIAKDVKLIEEKISPYNNMYEGKFVLQTMKDGSKYDELPLSYLEGKNDLYFPQSVMLCVRDYNGDGKKNDFILGQPMGSSNMAYQIYAVNETGEISQYDVSTDKQFYFAGGLDGYSPEFKCKDGQLCYKAYNQAEGKTEEKEISVVYVKSVGEQMLSSADTPEHRIMAGMDEVMPKLLMDEVYQSDWRTSYGTEKEVCYIIANKRRYDDVTMRLDFCYQNGVLNSYVSKDYGFVSEMPEDRITAKQASNPIQKFTEAFLGKKLGESDIKQEKLPARYEGTEDYYAYFTDKLGGKYLVDIKHNVLTQYNAAEA